MSSCHVGTGSCPIPVPFSNIPCKQNVEQNVNFSRLKPIGILSGGNMSRESVNAKGTPKTIEEAIANGLEEYGFYNNDKIAMFVVKHVKDFLAQKAFHRDEDIEKGMRELFDKVFLK